VPIPHPRNSIFSRLGCPRLALPVLTLLVLVSGCGGGDSGDAARVGAGAQGAEGGERAPGERASGGAPAGFDRSLLPPVPDGLVLARAALAPEGGLLLVECAADGSPRTATPDRVEDEAGGELLFLLRAFGSPRGGIPVWVVREGDEIIELRIAVPEGEGCLPLLFEDAQVVVSGNEPFWQLRILDDRAVIRTPELPDGVEFGAGRWATEEGFWVYEAERDFVDGMSFLTLSLYPTPCIDDMSGGRFPWTGFVEWEGQSLVGCAWEGGAHPAIRRSPAP
jgi:uncharacterized membrane protein